MSGRVGIRMCLAAVAAAAAVLGLPSVSGAATITVSATGDDNPTLIAESDNGICTLREAIYEANNDTATLIDDCSWTGTLGDDTITLNAGTYVLDVTGAADDGDQTGDLDVETDSIAEGLTIDGAGVGSTLIDPIGGWDDRVFHQVSGSSSNPLTITDLTITDGDVSGDGGGVNSVAGDLVLARVLLDSNTGQNNGGGVAASGTSLSITDSTVFDNDSGGSTAGGVLSLATTTSIESSVISENATGDSGGTQGGGMIAQNTDLTIADSVIADNDAIESGGGAADGGGLAVLNGSATIRGTEISGNRVVGGTGGRGGGLRVAGSAAVALVNSTVTGNEALATGDSGAGVELGGGTLTIVHSTIGQNPVVSGGASSLSRSSGTLNLRGSAIGTSSGEDACAGTIASQGHNVLTDATCGAVATGDEPNADSMLGPLQDNGGPDAGAPSLLRAVRSLAPAEASTAVDHVPAASCTDEPSGSLIVDQRGLPRPIDMDGDSVAECDAGSIELQPPPPPPGKCAGKTATITGTDAGEVLKGTSKRDIIAAKGGNDTVKGLGGNDLLCGGKGKDKLNGGKGKDTLRGDAGKDSLKGGAGKDTLKGGSNKDRCDGGAKKDKASGCETRRSL